MPLTPAFLSKVACFLAARCDGATGTSAAFWHTCLTHCPKRSLSACPNSHLYVCRRFTSSSVACGGDAAIFVLTNSEAFVRAEAPRSRVASCR